MVRGVAVPVVKPYATLTFEGPGAREPELSFREEILRGFEASPKRLSPKHLYDARGSALFDQICELPEYYLTRTELAIMRACAGEMARAIGPRAQLIELGAGSTVKVRLLLDALTDPTEFVAVDISGEHLESAVEELAADHPDTMMRAVTADFTRGFEISPAPGVPEPRRRVAYFPGSTIGNFDPQHATALLRGIADLVGPGGGLLIGTDLVKPVELLQEAYDDRGGVTARFILNVLDRIRDELGAELDPSQFEYVARWDDEAARMQMLVRSRRDQYITLGNRRFHFAAGEEMHVEYSHKYTLDRFAGLARDAGFDVDQVWTDPEQRFAVQLLSVRAERA